MVNSVLNIQRMTEMGYGEDIYKLALLSYRQREDLIEKLHALPGHKSKLNEFFRIIDHVRKTV